MQVGVGDTGGGKREIHTGISKVSMIFSAKEPTWTAPVFTTLAIYQVSNALQDYKLALNGITVSTIFSVVLINKFTIILKSVN